MGDDEEEHLEFGQRSQRMFEMNDFSNPSNNLFVNSKLFLTL